MRGEGGGASPHEGSSPRSPSCLLVMLLWRICVRSRVRHPPSRTRMSILYELFLCLDVGG